MSNPEDDNFFPMATTTVRLDSGPRSETVRMSQEFLEEFFKGPRMFTARTLSQRTKTPLPSVYRIVGALERIGWIRDVGIHRRAGVNMKASTVYQRAYDLHTVDPPAPMDVIRPMRRPSVRVRSYARKVR